MSKTGVPRNAPIGHGRGTASVKRMTVGATPLFFLKRGLQLGTPDGCVQLERDAWSVGCSEADHGRTSQLG